ncbi:MAG: hypothetical protein VB087_08565 [Candidatus Limiplasma sp.]|nr:hypothetical protein [Candidatus Limiplasma sp.]
MQAWLRRAFSQTDAPPWQGKAHRLWVWFLAACLALYGTYALYLSQSALFVTPADTLAALLWAIPVFGLVLWLLVRLWRVPGLPAFAATRRQLDARVFVGGTLVTLGILGVYLLAADPGGVSVDSAVQWTQANTGVFINWHPAFHTLLIRLVALVRPSYTFAVAVQCAAFSVALGYLLATLHAWGAKAAWLLPLAALTVAAPIVGHTMMYLWKDNAMTIGVTLLTAQAVNLYLSRGRWLEKRLNAVAFGLTLAFVTLVRHNGLLFSIPLLLTALLTCRAQLWRALLSALTLLATLWLVLGPLYGALEVTYPQNGLEEAIGLPMTVISNIRKQNPDALDAQTRAFTDRMADDAGWAAYQLDNYNSIKFGRTRALIAHTAPAEVLRMAAGAAKADPRGAFLAVNGVTDLVWGLGDAGSANVRVRNAGNLPGVLPTSGLRREVGAALKAFIAAPLQLAPLGWYYSNIGVSFLLLLVLCLRAIRRGGTRALLLCLPTLLYNLGTMAVLCGEDARFFSFSPLLCTLLLPVLLRDAPPTQEPHGEKAPA